MDMLQLYLTQDHQFSYLFKPLPANVENMVSAY
jgi:hypothetical protein